MSNFEKGFGTAVGAGFGCLTFISVIVILVVVLTVGVVTVRLNPPQPEAPKQESGGKDKPSTGALLVVFVVLGWPIWGLPVISVWGMLAPEKNIPRQFRIPEVSIEKMRLLYRIIFSCYLLPICYVLYRYFSK
jgi:hypothetical protein